MAAAAVPRAAAIGADADAAPSADAATALAFTCQLCRAHITLTGALDESSSSDHQHQHQHHHHDTANTTRSSRMDESFVVLPTTTAAAAAARAAAAAATTRSPSSAAAPVPTTPPTKGGIGMDAKLRALTALFEAASTSSGADHPLCLDCSARLREELERQAREADDDASAYERALARLGRRRGGQQQQQQQQRGSSSSTAATTTATTAAAAAAGEREEEEERPPPVAVAATPAAQFEAELAALREREASAKQRSRQLAGRLSEARRELAALEASEGAAVDALALQYWQDAAATQAALDHHVSERDALLAKTERATQRLAALRATSALNDACRIWHEGPFGTIGGFRLGRTPEHPVPWDEINAAWGLAVLLLSAMARSARVTFTGARRLLPLGSRARVADSRGTHDLFGPVSRLWTAPYDRAMTAYVGCLAEFGEFARARDLAEGRDPPFEFPFAVDGGAGTVGGHSVRLALNKEARWTRALKLMLADLKVALQWAARREAGAQQARSRAEAPRPLAPER